MKFSRLFSLPMGVSIGLGSVQTAGAVTVGQVDDFQGGTTQGWLEGAISPNPPTNVPDGGPLGVGDNYLQNVSSGGFGAGSRQVMFNLVQWSGDYVTAGVTRIEADMANFGATALSMRIAIEGGAPLGRYGSTSAVNLTPQTGNGTPSPFI